VNYQMNNHESSKTNWLQLVVLLACLAFAMPASADVTQRQKITSAPRGVGAQFGNAVAISGNTMVVGARFDSTTASQAGAAFVFVLNGTTWTQQATLLANDGAAGDKFGQSVAISGDTIVVGAYQANAPLSNGGAAYVFVRNGTTWTQQQKLTASDGTADDEFGNSVAIKDDTVVVGAHFADLPSNSAAGAAYRFMRSGTVWIEVQKLTPSGATLGGNQFGESLAVSGDKLVVGSDHDDTPETAAGAVYVFVDSGAAYSPQQKLTIGNGTNGDLFGFSVAIEGNTLVGGAREDTAASGAAYVFEFNGATWTLQQKLTASDAAAFDRFGWSVAVSNNVVAVGAREDDDTVLKPDVGSAYVFTRSGTTWTEQQKITPDDAINGDRFGASVALSLGQLVVGAAEKALTSPNGQGAVYTFRGARSVFPDFDGDEKADLSFFRPSDGTWGVRKSSDNSSYSTSFGQASDLLAPADYDGDRKTDLAVFRPADGNWFVQGSNSGGTVIVQFGLNGDIPMPADYDGDGRADLAVFRPSTGLWLIQNSSNSQVVSTTFGSSTDKPLIGDFDGDGKSDISVFRPSTGQWAIVGSSNGTIFIVQFGLTGDIPAPADYDGDGTTDVAVFRPSTGTWFIRQSSNSTDFIIQFGLHSDNPVPADYDGDGKADVAIYRPSTATWYVLRSETLTYSPAQFGASGDRPVPLFFVRQPLPGASSLQFSAANYNVNEDPTSALITVTRTGDSSAAVSVGYATSDGTAHQTSDYSNVLGTLTFASGETSKTFSVPINEDSLVEGTETATLTLSSPAGGAVLGTQATATLTILDDATEPSTNTLDVPEPYVSQQYHDFFSRDADAPGLAFWTNEISSCGSNAQCIETKRVNVSAAFFLSIEFQQTGYLVYRFYNAALNRSNGLPRYAEFLRDTQGVGRGVVVNAAGWEAVLEANKVAYANEFVASSEFTALYPLTQTPAQFVDALYAHAVIVPGAAERQAAIDEFNTDPTTARARVLRRVAEHPTLVQREFNRAFVLMQYFGYLRRNPDDAPDNNLNGYNFWLGKLNQFNGDFVAAEMVKAFIQSSEYRHRFGQ